ncbi:hypothetical protein HYW35_02885 [Candidatus Saccharibacteria bacterium]|nr:hypothetical protein [Candidatus Saccharibacteria bacterium]
MNNLNPEDSRKIGDQISAGWSKVAGVRLKEIPDYYTRLNKMEGESHGNSQTD